MCRGSAATSSRSSSTASAASSTAATTPPGSRSTPTGPRPPPLLPLLMRPTPGRRRLCSARRARSRTSCDPYTPVSSLLIFFFCFCPLKPSVPECFLAQSGFWLLHAVKASILTGFQVTIPGQFSCLVLQFWIILLFLFRIVTLE